MMFASYTLPDRLKIFGGVGKFQIEFPDAKRAYIKPKYKKLDDGSHEENGKWKSQDPRPRTQNYEFDLGTLRRGLIPGKIKP